MRDRSILFYDVAISFAGEDRRHARGLADELVRRGVSVFYDESERSVLWGKDLYAYLSEIYQNKAYFCVAFLSSAFARKAWTNLERKAAQARAFSEQGEYLLPIRLDDTEIPGILPTTGYITWPPDDATSTARFLVDKLTREGRRGAVPVVSDDAAPHQTTHPGALDPFALKTFLDAELGPDGRMTPFSYSFLAGQLEWMGFATIDQLKECVCGCDQREICKALHSGRRQGQTTTFKDLLLAGMGPNYLRLHKWSPEHWFRARCLVKFRQLDEAGIAVGHYEPVESSKT